MSKWILGIISVGLVTWTNSFAAKPVITSLSHDSTISVRSMGEPVFVTVKSVDKGGDSRNLVYEWALLELEDSTCSKAVFLNPKDEPLPLPPNDIAAKLGFPWVSAESASSCVGKQIRVGVTVSFEDAQVGVDESDTAEFVFQIDGVNNPPTGSIVGNTSSSDNRIPPGSSVALRAEASDPDGPSPGPKVLWGLGSKTGGIYQPAGPTLFASEGSQTAFTVPNMTAPINQEVLMVLKDGLHMVTTTTTVFMTNEGGDTPPPPSGNQAPTLTVSQSTVTADLGGQAVLEAIANDVDGDDLAFTWIFLQTNTTVDASAVQTVRLNATQWRSRATIPAASVGSFGFSVRARETNTSDQKASPTLNVTLLINPEGGSGPGAFESDQQNCSGNSGPTLVSISPDPRVSQLQIGAGQTLQVTVEFSDNSEASSPFPPGFVTGVKEIAWNVGSLNSNGLQTSQGAVTKVSDNNARRTLTITAPSSVNAANPQFSVTATDVLECTTTITTDLNVIAGTGGGTTPTARIRYKFSQGASFSGPLSPGATVNTDIRTIFLDATQSSVDGGTGTLSYQWAVSGIAGASLSSATAPAPTLTIPQEAEGTATVTLTASVSGGGSSSATLNFNIGGSFQPPVAFITSAPPLAEAGSQINLEGDAEAEGGEPPDFVFQWTAFTPNGPVEVFSSGPRANLIAPAPTGIDEEQVLTIELRVSLNGVQSQTRTRQIVVTRPRLNFAHVGVGPIPSDDGKSLRLETQMVLVNPTGTPVEGEIQFINNSEGDDWAPLVNGEALSDLQFTIPATGSREFLLTGDSINVGWALLKSPERLVGHLFYRVVEILPDGGKALISEVPILPVRGGKFRTALVPGMGAEELAFSLVNLADHAGSVTFTLTLNSGEKVESAPIELESREQTARFLNEVSQTISLLLGQGFEGGTLSIQSEDGIVFAVTLIRSTLNGLPRSILPVAVDSN